MIDLIKLREEGAAFKEQILKKDPKFEIDVLEQLDKNVRLLKQEVENLRKEKHDLSKEGAKGISDELRTRSVELGKKLEQKEKELSVSDEKLKALWLTCPNAPLDEVPYGGKESNKIVETVGEKTKFSFTPKNHVEIGEKLGYFDFESAAKISGTGFVLYKPLGVRLMYGLTTLMLRNNIKNGYAPHLPPYLVSERSLINSGNLPKFADDLYKVGEDNLYPIPTAEVPLTNIYADKILPADELPIRMCGWTSCFRREAGSHGANERGLIRIHQFEKVELYSITKQEDSNTELDRMVACAQEILKQLGLHYQISLLAGQDCSFSSAKTYDIEVWLPGQNRFYEVSSASNCTDFQARRAQIRYRTTQGKPILAHTLNASSLAIPRLMVALLENYQQEDGSVKFPLVLEDAMKMVW